MQGFMDCYNREHRHSGIQFVTPEERHSGRDREILAKRDVVYAIAKAKHPKRWSGKTRNWDPIGDVWLNPENAPASGETVKAL